MKKFFSFLAALISFVTLVGAAFITVSYFFYSKQKKLQNLFDKSSSEEEA